VVEKVFERRAEEVDDEDVVKAFLTEVIDIRYASYQNISMERLVNGL
jgi:hypothetical protein